MSCGGGRTTWECRSPRSSTSSRTRAATRRTGLRKLCPSTTRTEDVADAIAFAYANDWVGFDTVVRWGEDRELPEDDLRIILEACARQGHASPLHES